MTRSTTAGLAATACALLFATSAEAGEREHTVQPGESVSAIAERYYGDFEPVELLLQYNGKRDARIHPGERLAIPVSEIHEVEPGDTWSELAQRYLGDPAAYDVVARLNGLSPDAPLTVGATITMPAILPHRLERGETLVNLAERYYDDGTASELLARFNAIDDPRRLSTGQTIRLPLLAFRVVDGNAPDEARAAPVATPEPQRVATAAEPVEPARRPPEEPPRRFAAELSAAAASFERGRYDAARERLEALIAPIEAAGADADRAELARLLAFVYVAFDLPAAACRAYARGTDATADLDPDRVSPKIRQALAACGRSDAGSSGATVADTKR